MSFENFDTSIRKSAGNQFPIELKINYQLLAQELLKVLRGKVSQRQLSERLGFSFNQVGKWESGATLIKWDDFLDVCDLLKIPLESCFRYSFWNLGSEFTATTSLMAIIQKYNLFNSHESTKDRSLLKKWQAGESFPTLAEVLQLIGKKSPTLFGWLSLFVDCSKLAVIKRPYEFFIKNIDVVLSDPISCYVNAALNVEEYAKLEFHDAAVLSQHATCTIEQLNHSLQTLINCDLIYFDGKKYHPSSFDFSFSGLRHPKLRGLTKYTTNLTAARYSMVPVNQAEPNRIYNPSQSSVRVVAMSAEAAKKVVDLIVQFHNQVDEVVKNDRGIKSNVQIILVHSYASTINSPKTAPIEC